MNVLEQAQDIVDKLYQLTAGLSFIGDDENEDSDIEAYIAMVDAREPLIKELAALRGEMDTATQATPEFAEIVRCIDDIAELDREHLSFFEKLREEVQSSIKEIKKGRQINNAYSSDAMYDDAVRVDTKK
ncbi:MAG: flagellar protein FliT [Defluviitaleaceae bacterium]|nr:flagellar protein FliT [Defluviitaleaceae bacterium]MCL2239909.1 flagellar protein FliT [Defluviitaleaceae bacterium]